MYKQHSYSVIFIQEKQLFIFKFFMNVNCKYTSNEGEADLG